MPYLYLLIAVALEVSGTMLLPVSQNFTRPLPTVSLIACYAASFYCLTFAPTRCRLRWCMPLGQASVFS